MKKLILIAALICAPAFAQSADPRPVLWGDLRYGMTKDEVKAAMPKDDIKLSALCRALPGPFYRDGKLFRFSLRETMPSANTCNGELINGLTQRYGAPVGSSDQKIGTRTLRHLVWQSGRLQIAFDEGEVFWHLQYSLLDSTPEPIANKL